MHGELRPWGVTLYSHLARGFFPPGGPRDRKRWSQVVPRWNVEHEKRYGV